MNIIDKTAVVSPTAQIGKDVKIGAYAIVEDNTIIGDNTIIDAHAKVCSGARIGKSCRVCSFAIVSGEPQDLHFDTSLKTYVEIGDGTVLREHISVHRATVEGKATVIGKGCLLMDGAHVGHDCVVGDNVIIANFTALAGHVHVDKDVFISGGVMVHQRQRIGEGCILSGNGAFSLDVPPYVIAYERNKLAGLNLIGMSRRGMTREEISEIKRLYAQVYSTMSARINAMALLEAGDFKSDYGRRFLEFFKVENRRYCQPREGK